MQDASHGFIWWIIVGLIAGFITGKLMRGEGFGALVDIIVGILGAVAGGFLMSHLGFAGQGGLLLHRLRRGDRRGHPYAASSGWLPAKEA